MGKLKTRKSHISFLIAGLILGGCLTLLGMYFLPLITSVNLPDFSSMETSAFESKLKNETLKNLYCSQIDRHKNEEGYLSFRTSQIGFPAMEDGVLSMEDSEKISSALSRHLDTIPPNIHPGIFWCKSDEINILITEGTNFSDRSDLYVLVLDKSLNYLRGIKLKVEDEIRGTSKVLGFTVENKFYLKVFGRDSKIFRTAESVVEIDVVSGGNKTVARSVWSLIPPNSSPPPEGVLFDPIDRGTTYDKKFKRGENLMIHGSFEAEINGIPEEDLIGGYCDFYSYSDSEKIFKSAGYKTHPRYGGRWAPDLTLEESSRLLAALQKLRQGISDKIGYIDYCNLEPDKRIVISEPSKHQKNRDVYVGLLNEDLELVNKVQLKAPPDGYISSVDPIAFTKQGIFYLKLSGQLFDGGVNLFKINFPKNSYEVLYKGK